MLKVGLMDYKVLQVMKICKKKCHNNVLKFKIKYNEV